jgi:CRISPR-associated protein Cmr3
LCLEPLDVLHFRDGRPLTGSARSKSGLPLPQTLAGSLRTALLRLAGCDFGRLKQQIEAGSSFDEAVQQSCDREHHWIGELAVRGPWLARGKDSKNATEVLVPAPAVLLAHKKQQASLDLKRLVPLPTKELPTWNPPADQQGLRPLWLKDLATTKPAEGYLTPNGLEKFLGGNKVAPSEIVPSSDLFELDYRTGIGISPDRFVAEEALIFGRGFLAFQKNVFLYGEMVIPAEASAEAMLDQIKTLALGGEARHVILKRLTEPFARPCISTNGNQKPLILLTTPCPFEAGWRPRIFDGQLVAAAVPGSVPFSGWDLARGGPKPTRFAAVAGSVYFLQSLPSDWAQSVAENEEDRRQGWGCCLTGVWTDE